MCPHNLIFITVLNGSFFCCSKITVSLRYADLLSVLPTRIRVLAWPMQPSKKIITSTGTIGRKGNSVPARLSYAEDALRTMSLPEGFTSFQIKKVIFLLISGQCL